MNKLAELIERLPPNDIFLIKKDLEEGNLHKLISKKLNKEEKLHAFCPVCGGDVNPKKSYVLEFGKEIRKRAYFDEVDCLKYFLEKLK